MVVELTMAERDPSAGKVIRRKLDRDPIAGEHADIVLPHLAGQMAQHVLAALELDGEHCIRKRLGHLAINGQGIGVLTRTARLGGRAGVTGRGGLR